VRRPQARATAWNRWYGAAARFLLRQGRVSRPLLAALIALAACDGAAPCESTTQPWRARLGCAEEFEAQAARPLDAALPGARTVKTIVDQTDGDAIYFMDTASYPLHSTFAVDYLGYPPGAPFVNEYFVPQRRFLLGAVTHYEEPDIWAYELAPYDTASVDMIARGFRRLAGAAYFGARLRFHPVSAEQEARAADLPADVPVVTTDEIYAGISYQPLNLGETYAQVRVLAAADLATTYVSPRELVVLDHVPNDLGTVAGVVTEDFQTPLSHVNVLAQQRGIPNMGLRGAQAALLPHQGKWVHLRVAAFEWSVAEVSQAEADAWWQAHRPPPAEIPAPDYGVTGILSVDDVGHGDVAAVGGKAANYGELRAIGAAVRVRPALVVPVAYYRDFLVDNGFDADITAMLADPDFGGDAAVRRAMLADLQARMQVAPVDPALIAALEARLDGDFPVTRMKFRSSTNAEDLERHTGAGLYTSAAGQAHDPTAPVDAALRTVWASVWSARAFEERDAAGIDPTRVAMAVLVTPAYRDEAGNGVAISANLYDPGPTGEDAFYVNAQVGEVSVVQPDPDIVAEQLMYYYFHSGQPATVYTHSSLLPAGESVLARAELFDLGTQLAAVRDHFAAIYDRPGGFARLPMDVEWKLVVVGGDREIWIKQARPYPGRGATP